LKEKKGTFQILLQNQPLFQVKKRDTGLKILDFIYFYEESAMDNEYFDEDEDLSDDEDLEMSEEMVDEEPSDKQKPFFNDEDKAEPGSARSFETPTIEKTSVAHIPITVHMELARINVSLAELKAMAPGEQLPVEINPRSVNLTVN